MDKNRLVRVNLTLQLEVLNVSFEYTDWDASKFGPGGKFDYYRYKSLVFCLKWNTQLKECMKLNNM